jgi:hypothetical protein
MSIPMKVQAALSQFEGARAALEGFRQENIELVEEYEILKEAYNTALQNVKTVYKDNHEAVGRKLGDFAASTSTLIDAERLVELMGDKVDPLIKTKLSVDRKQYNKAVELGLIPGEVIDEVEMPGPVRVRGPKAL